jgi:hypothetical protein
MRTMADESRKRDSVEGGLSRDGVDRRGFSPQFMASLGWQRNF